MDARWADGFGSERERRRDGTGRDDGGGRRPTPISDPIPFQRGASLRLNRVLSATRLADGGSVLVADYFCVRPRLAARAGVGDRIGSDRIGRDGTRRPTSVRRRRARKAKRARKEKRKEIRNREETEKKPRNRAAPVKYVFFPTTNPPAVTTLAAAPHAPLALVAHASPDRGVIERLYRRVLHVQRRVHLETLRDAVHDEVRLSARGVLILQRRSVRSDVGVEFKGVRSGVERQRGRGLKPRDGRRDATGKVLKDRRSPRGRGRMGTGRQRVRVGALHDDRALAVAVVERHAAAEQRAPVHLEPRGWDGGGVVLRDVAHGDVPGRPVDVQAADARPRRARRRRVGVLARDVALADRARRARGCARAMIGSGGESGDGRQRGRRREGGFDRARVGFEAPHSRTNNPRWGLVSRAHLGRGARRGASPRRGATAWTPSRRSTGAARVRARSPGAVREDAAGAAGRSTIPDRDRTQRWVSPTRALFKVFYWCLFAGVRAFIRQSRVVSDSRESRAHRVARRAVGSAARLDSTRPVSTRLDPMPRPLPIAAARLMTRRALLSKMNDDDDYDDDDGFFFSSPFSWIIVGAIFMILLAIVTWNVMERLRVVEEERVAAERAAAREEAEDEMKDAKRRRMATAWMRRYGDGACVEVAMPGGISAVGYKETGREREEARGGKDDETESDEETTTSASRYLAAFRQDSAERAPTTSFWLSVEDDDRRDDSAHGGAVNRRARAGNVVCPVENPESRPPSPATSRSRLTTSVVVESVERPGGAAETASSSTREGGDVERGFFGEERGDVERGGFLTCDEPHPSRAPASPPPPPPPSSRPVRRRRQSFSLVRLRARHGCSGHSRSSHGPNPSLVSRKGFLLTVSSSPPAAASISGGNPSGYALIDAFHFPALPLPPWNSNACSPKTLLSCSFAATPAAHPEQRQCTSPSAMTNSPFAPPQSTATAGGHVRGTGKLHGVGVELKGVRWS
eukprot:30067-Pelagococcus_subviridis.AAC.2